MALTDKQIKGLPPNRLLLRAVQEAGELIQAITKYIEHGEFATDADGVHYDNYRDMCVEYEQLRAHMIEIMERHSPPYGVTVTHLAKERNGD